MRRTLLFTALIALLSGSLPLWSGVAHAAPPDFEDDISLGMSAAKLKKLGFASCGPQRMCGKVRWSEKLWNAEFRQDAAGALRNVVLSENAGTDAYADAALETLEEFAVEPVQVNAGQSVCDAFAAVRNGASPEQAVRRCQEVLDGTNEEPEVTVLYIDEEQVNALLAKKISLEAAGRAAPGATVVRLTITPKNGVRMLYAAFGTLDQN